MKIYCATKWERREEQAKYNDLIRKSGHQITHDWTRFETELEPGFKRRYAAGMLDYAGVMQADMLILWDSDEYELNGARWEAGMAAARGIPIWIVEYSNTVIFDVLPQVSIIPDWDEVLRLLARLDPRP